MLMVEMVVVMDVVVWVSNCHRCLPQNVGFPLHVSELQERHDTCQPMEKRVEREVGFFLVMET